jgi:hypothetical protein
VRRFQYFSFQQAVEVGYALSTAAPGTGSGNACGRSAWAGRRLQAFVGAAAASQTAGAELDAAKKFSGSPRLQRLRPQLPRESAGQQCRPVFAIGTSGTAELTFHAQAVILAPASLCAAINAKLPRW